jgi:hypothetical protein
MESALPASDLGPREMERGGRDKNGYALLIVALIAYRHVQKWRYRYGSSIKVR